MAPSSVTYEVRAAAGLNMIATYTLSKQIERWGFNDSQRGIVQEGLYPWDRPQRFTVGSVYQLPIGKGKRFLNSSHPILSRMFSGWENNWVFQWQSGAPWRLPRDNDHNVLYVKEAKIDHIDWSAPQVYGVKPCVAEWNDNGSITLQPYSVAYGCADYHFLIMPRYAPYVSPRRDGRLRLHSVPQADVSLNKNTRVTEKTSIQFRAEAFNVFNTFMFHQQNFNNDPENSNFGTITKATVGQGSANFPRQIQLAVKLIW